MGGATLEINGVTYRHKVSDPTTFKPWKTRIGPGVVEVSLSLNEGEILGLVGPNGAGKTTLLRTISGVLPIQSGSFTRSDDNQSKPIEAIELRAMVGHMPEQVRWQGQESVHSALMELAEMRGASEQRVSGLLKLVGLSERRNASLSGLSQGMRQRLTLAASLLGSPKFLMLDEPLNGLDPVAAAAFVKLLHQLKGKGVSIVISSHQVEGLQAITDRIALMHRGQILACGTMETLAQSLSLQPHISITGTGPIPDLSWCEANVVEMNQEDEAWTGRLLDDEHVSIEGFVKKGIAIKTWTPVQPGIVEMLCAATGMDIDEVGLEIASSSLLPHRTIGGEEE
jgi:ABC-type multidrug transport system ATPase subunit